MKLTDSFRASGYCGQRWLWIELLGFEIGDPDYGVDRLCERAGFIPDGISLLISDPEFVHGHRGDEDRSFPPTICSYGGHPYNEERSRQPWTARDLKGLVAAIRNRGIQVFYTHFDAPVGEWFGRHPEVRSITRKGETLDCLCPYKRLSDGRLYGDFYLPLMVQTVRDFGFDGFHAGDGFAHPRLPLFEGDFSDDNVDQYLEWSAGSLPSTLKRRADGNAGAIQQRAEWLWREERTSWIEFHRQRTVNFWSKAADLLHAEGKRLFLNSCWTRDPFEALYRYGVDYRALGKAGVDGFFAETAAAAQEYGGDLPYREDGFDHWDPSRVMSRFATNLLLLRAAVPTAEIIFMNGIKDTNEAWCGIRHAPVNVESEILIYTGLFQVGAKGVLTPSSSGLLVTLADGLAKHEWDWLRTRWNLGGSLQPKKLMGAAVYWSDAYPDAMVQDYIRERLIPFDRLLWKLMVHGAPILATVRQENLADWTGPLVVLHPRLLPQEEWRQIRNRRGAPLLVLGAKRKDDAETDPAYSISDSMGIDALDLNIYCPGELEAPLAPILPEPERFEAASALDPVQWMYDLPAREVTPEFFRHAADWVTALSGGVRVLKNEHDIRAWGYVIGEDRLRIHVRNDGFYYRAAAVDVGCPVAAVETLTAFPGTPVIPSGSVLRFKLAGKSMAIFEVATNI